MLETCEGYLAAPGPRDRFSIEKCAIAKSYINYLGHMIGNGELYSTDKTQHNMQKVVEKASIDQTDKEWERLFGFFQSAVKKKTLRCLFFSNVFFFDKKIGIFFKKILLPCCRAPFEPSKKYCLIDFSSIFGRVFFSARWGGRNSRFI